MDLNNNSPPLSIGLDFLDLAINSNDPSDLKNLTLCRKLIADKTINFKSIKYILLNEWSLGPHSQIIHMNPNQSECSFSKEVDKDYILALSPWALRVT